MPHLVPGRARGFSLIELMLVLVVVGILSAILVGKRKSAARVNAKTEEKADPAEVGELVFENQEMRNAYAWNVQQHWLKCNDYGFTRFVRGGPGLRDAGVQEGVQRHPQGPRRELRHRAVAGLPARGEAPPAQGMDAGDRRVFPRQGAR